LKPKAQQKVQLGLSVLRGVQTRVGQRVRGRDTVAAVTAAAAAVATAAAAVVAVMIVMRMIGQMSCLLRLAMQQSSSSSCSRIQDAKPRVGGGGLQTRVAAAVAEAGGEVDCERLT
jgi:hypothetical protein